jgi:hypothetical protein
MSFSQHLVLWLHVAFVIFTIGPATMAIMSTPRYIRKRDFRILRYLTRMTLIFGIGTLGILIAGLVLSSMIGKAAKPWIIVSETLFVVSLLLLGLIHRDQRHAIKALEAAADTAAHVAAPAGPPAEVAGGDAASQLPAEPAATPAPAYAGAGEGTARQRASGQASAGQPAIGGPLGRHSGASGDRRARPDRHDRGRCDRDLAGRPGADGLEQLTW